MIEFPTFPMYVYRFIAGSVGTFVYLFCTKNSFGVPQLEIDEYNANSTLKSCKVRSTLIIIGGSIASFTNTNNLLICFVEGLLLRRLILAIFEGKSRIVKNIIDSYFKG